MAERLHNGLYKCTDLENGDTWYSDHLEEHIKKSEEYVDECEGDCILAYSVYDFTTGKYRRMKDREVKEAKLPR